MKRPGHDSNFDDDDDEKLLGGQKASFSLVVEVRIKQLAMKTRRFPSNQNPSPPEYRNVEIQVDKEFPPSAHPAPPDSKKNS